MMKTMNYNVTVFMCDRRSEAEHTCCTVMSLVVRRDVQMKRFPAETCDPSLVTVNSRSPVTKCAADLLTTHRVPDTDLCNVVTHTHVHSFYHMK